LMARLMLDHDGTVEVAEQGGIFYRFEALRRTAEVANLAGGAPHAAWETPKKLAPLTGNGIGATWASRRSTASTCSPASSCSPTGSRSRTHVDVLEASACVSSGRRHPVGARPRAGAVLCGHLLPTGGSRCVSQPQGQARRGRRTPASPSCAEVLARAPKKEPVPDEVLRTAYRVATGVEPSSKEITRRVVDLGGRRGRGPRG